MAKLRPRQLELSKTVPSKLGFDGEEDAWVFVKKQRIIIVLPSLPLPEQHLTMEKPAITSQLEAELRESMEDTQESTFLHTVVPALPLPEHFIMHKPENSESQAELRDVLADTHKTTTPVPTVVVPTPLQTGMSPLLLPEHFVLQKPATSQSQADTHETTLLQTVIPSPPVPDHYSLQKPAASISQSELRMEISKATLEPTTSKSQAELRTETHKAILVHTVMPSLPVPEHYTMPSLPVPEHYSIQKPSTSQSQAELRADTRKATLVHTVVPSLPVTEHCTLQKPATSQSQAELRDLVADTHEASRVHTVEPEAYPDFTSVDKPEIVMSRSLTTRKAPAPKRSLQDCRMNQDRRVEVHRRRAGHKPIRFPRVMCSSVVIDNEKLRVLNLEKKVEKAGGLHEWVGSIGLGREFERMLRGQKMSKFQMANLTMEKLKQMGALAVGPRRKLIHAIGCVYHPHCLRASFN
ncbi:hypothetical protein ARALYDRAFT_478533 [Arabidopsis lyrata subsp. lyrata]|uniref:SAM domain-containing protein n=1 Tax=Arabidopsis lyrata subsp. lyrata TaxID=81972 RepID=D7LAS6_ARALL|nr:hypothetical protein ARALYDRAFT_478533 [Arabidopsis lyrata subsp. lyrata]